MAFETQAQPTFTRLMDPPADASWTQVQIWLKQVNEHVKRGTMLTENLKMAYSLIYGQCSDAMRVKLESQSLIMVPSRAQLTLLASWRTSGW